MHATDFIFSFFIILLKITRKKNHTFTVCYLVYLVKLLLLLQDLYHSHAHINVVQN